LKDGARTPNPRFFRNDERKLVREQRKLCRKKRGSNRYHKQRLRVAKVHRRTADRRRDFLHKHTTELIRSHDAVIIENLNVRALARTKLGKSFSDAALGEWRQQLQYKAEWYGKRLVVVSCWFPSTKACSVCGTIDAALTLSDRRWTCDRCGTVHDRDHNAAKNIRAEGLRLLGIFVQDRKTVAEGHPDTLNARGG
jgi:putative transposase